MLWKARETAIRRTLVFPQVFREYRGQIPHFGFGSLSIGRQLRHWPPFLQTESVSHLYRWWRRQVGCLLATWVAMRSHGTRRRLTNSVRINGGQYRRFLPYRQALTKIPDSLNYAVTIASWYHMIYALFRLCYCLSAAEHITHKQHYRSQHQ
jgi:hypothetical protein